MSTYSPVHYVIISDNLKVMLDALLPMQCAWYSISTIQLITFVISPDLPSTVEICEVQVMPVWSCVIPLLAVRLWPIKVWTVRLCWILHLPVTTMALWVSIKVCESLFRVDLFCWWGPNWESYAVQVQAMARVLDHWDIRSKHGSQSPYIQLVSKTHNAKDFAVANIAWNKKTSQALGLIQGTISPAIWPDFVNYGTVK